MRPLDTALIATYTVTSTAAIMLIKQQIRPAIDIFKISPNLSIPALLLILGAILYGCSFMLWMLILARIQLSVAYPIVIGATLMATTVGSYLVLKEPLPALRVAGIAVIFIGVTVVTRT
jgi:multidrug transporter EmrE-like cation transporter